MCKYQRGPYKTLTANRCLKSLLKYVIKHKIKNSNNVYWIVLRCWLKIHSAALARGGKTHKISKSVGSEG